MFTYKDKFRINASMLVLVFDYSLRGEYGYACIAGILCMVYAMYTHSPNILMARKYEIVEEVTVLYVLINVFSLDEFLPNILFLAIVATIFAVMWASSSMKIVQSTLKETRIVYLVSVIYCLCLPTSTIQYALHSDAASANHMILLVSIMFVPYMKQCSIKTIRRVARYASGAVKWYDTNKEFSMR